MRKAATLLAALVAGTCVSSLASASVGPALPTDSGPTELPPGTLPATLSDLSSMPVDPHLEVGGEVGILVRHPNVQAHRVVAPTLSLRPGLVHTAIYTEFTVGHVGRFHPEQPNTFTWRAPASTDFEAESDFLRTMVVGPDFLDALAERFDINDDERPWSTTTTVHMLTSTTDFLEPFATLAYEEDSVETYDRLGIGGGFQFKFDDSTTLGAEAIYFGDRVDEALPRETRFLAKFELDF